MSGGLEKEKTRLRCGSAESTCNILHKQDSFALEIVHFCATTGNSVQYVEGALAEEQGEMLQARYAHDR